MAYLMVLVVLLAEEDFLIGERVVWSVVQDVGGKGVVGLRSRFDGENVFTR